MLATSARIIRDNWIYYLLMALLIVVWETTDNLRPLGESTHTGAIGACVLLCARLPSVVLQGGPLNMATAFKSPETLIIGFQVALIASILAGFMIYLEMNAYADLPHGAELPIFDKLVLAGLLVIVQPMIVTFLGSWIPAGVMKKEPGFLLAIGRGFLSIHTVYWRLVLSLGASLLLSLLIIFVYMISFGSAPSIVTPSGSIAPWSIVCWYLVSLVWLALLTYVNVVVCVCYARAEKIDLGAASRATEGG